MKLPQRVFPPAIPHISGTSVAAALVLAGVAAVLLALLVGLATVMRLR